MTGSEKFLTDTYYQIGSGAGLLTVSIPQKKNQKHPYPDLEGFAVLPVCRFAVLIFHPQDNSTTFVIIGALEKN